MDGVPISLFEEATERTSSKDGEDGWMICSECAELEEEPLLANTTLIWQTRILSGDRLGLPFSLAGLILVPRGGNHAIRFLSSIAT